MSNEINKDILCILAQRDLDAANQLAVQYRPSYEIVSYLCQQSAEKYLKGFLDFNSVKYPFIHDLQTLHSICISFDSRIEELRAACTELWIISRAARYTNPSELTARDMKHALQYAGQIRECVLSHMFERGYTPPEPYTVSETDSYMESVRADQDAVTATAVAEERRKYLHSAAVMLHRSGRIRAATRASRRPWRSGPAGRSRPAAI